MCMRIVYCFGEGLAIMQHDVKDSLHYYSKDLREINRTVDRLRSALGLPGLLASPSVISPRFTSDDPLIHVIYRGNLRACYDGSWIIAEQPNLLIGNQNRKVSVVSPQHGDPTEYIFSLTFNTACKLSNDAKGDVRFALVLSAAYPYHP